MDTPPRRVHAPLERQRSENNHIRDGRWPLRIAALTAAVALILVLMFNFMAPRWRLDAPSATGTPATEPTSSASPAAPAAPAAPSMTPPQADPATAPATTAPR
ncbi:hypothetical protein HMPREF9701_01497 [Delftia acidovorans CCUG 274B]|uniref:hypothetical protein n=1 Tax=Delftia acidovorans TaxID=80866 RepID=UPI00035345FD|nr:hypothetical protein [Delftia acidovorans]EPD42785.1 hypothetical protein HMPREF9701_01497 [Delftia acidovorans CCUG 274B]PZP72696.1 MAG: hypothetical protein DI604_13805 [Delftia acidovorans]